MSSTAAGGLRTTDEPHRAFQVLMAEISDSALAETVQVLSHGEAVQR